MQSKKFTVRMKPFCEESLYSFILRFANGNGISFLKFWNAVKKPGSHFVEMGDVGVLNFAPINVIDPLKMASLTGLDVEDIFKMSFYYAIKKFCGNSKVERARFFSGMLRNKLYYCPNCLREDLYHRLLWGIKGIYKCIFHNTELISKCPNCNKNIKLKDLYELSICPYCKYKLENAKSIAVSSESELQYQKWMHDAFNTLLSRYSSELKPSQIAMRSLFIINRQKLIFDRDFVEKTLYNKRMLPTLLQHARESLSNKRTLHISFILSVLYENNISMKEFLNIKIPNDFTISVKNKVSLKKDEVCCIAPWCKNYMKKESLVKTGTTFKRRNNGDIYKYYLICPECGCEYAFDENDELKERTYFIRNYYLINNLTKQELGLKGLAERTGLSQEMLRRCLAYFQSRGIFIGECNRKNYDIDELILYRFIKAIKDGIHINEIKKWSVWEGYNHFLFYRYYKDVAKEINTHRDKNEEKCEEGEDEKQNFIQNVLKKMINKNIDITIKSVCKEVHVCPETLRNWGCSNIIIQAKSEQKNIRIEELKSSTYKKVEQFFNKNHGQIIVSEELYKFIGIRRDILWRFAPEITSSLSNACREHNKIVRNII